jgi:hypothetical protein
VIVVVDLEEDRVSLAEPADFGRFHVQVVGGWDEGAADLLLGGVGRLESIERAWIDVRAVRVLAGDVVDEEWDTGFDAMIDFAGSKGWLSEDGTAIQAHVEWPPDDVA